MTPTTYHNKIRKDTMRFGLSILVVLIGIGTTFFHLVEGNGWFNSLYFVVMTLSTVGYGDIVPQTIVGKLITMIYAITGVPFFIFIGGFIIEQRMSSLVKKYVKDHNKEFVKLETELDIVTENVQDLNENINTITDQVEEIVKND